MTQQPAYEPDPAEGWVRDLVDIPFMRHIGPAWHRQFDGVAEYGFMPRPEIHGNHFRRLHGGMISAFADYAIGHACLLAGGGAMPHVTVHLGIDYIAAGSPDTWTTCRVLTLRRTRSLAFMRGEIFAGDTLLANATGVWKAIRAGGPVGVPPRAE